MTETSFDAEVLTRLLKESDLWKIVEGPIVSIRKSSAAESPSAEKKILTYRFEVTTLERLQKIAEESPQGPVYQAVEKDGKEAKGECEIGIDVRVAVNFMTIESVDFSYRLIRCPEGAIKAQNYFKDQ